MLKNLKYILIFLIIIIFAIFLKVIYHSEKNAPISKLDLDINYFNNDLLKQEIDDQYWLVHFFASWCSVCQSQINDLEKIRLIWPNKIIGISFKDSHLKTLEFQKNHPDLYNNIIEDFTGNIGLDFGLKGVPETFLVDPKGKVVMRYTGAISLHDFNKYFLKAINND